MLVHHKVRRKVVLKELDVGMSAGGGKERALNLGPSEIGSMYDATIVMSTFTGQVQAAVIIASEVSSHADQLQYAGWALTADHLNSPEVRKLMHMIRDGTFASYLNPKPEDVTEAI